MPFYGTYWHQRATKEFEFIYDRRPFSLVDETQVTESLNIESLMSLINEVVEKYVRSAGTHFGERRLNSSTMAWLIFQTEQELLSKRRAQ